MHRVIHRICASKQHVMATKGRDHEWPVALRHCFVASAADVATPSPTCCKNFRVTARSQKKRIHILVSIRQILNPAATLLYNLAGAGRELLAPGLES